MQNPTARHYDEMARTMVLTAVRTNGLTPDEVVSYTTEVIEWDDPASDELVCHALHRMLDEGVLVVGEYGFVKMA